MGKRFKWNAFLMLGCLIGNNSFSQDFICQQSQFKTQLIPTQSLSRLNFTNWADYMHPKIIPCFEKLTNTNVRLSYTTDDNMTGAKVMTGASGFDVIEQGSLYLPSEIKAQALIKLDKKRLPNWQYRNQAIYEKIAQMSDPSNQHAIVYSYGTTGIAYNEKAIQQVLGKKIVPNQWKYLFDPKYLKKLSYCGVSLLDQPEQIFGNYFHYIGVDPNTTDKAAYERAALYLIKNVRPYIKYFDSNKYQNDLTAGNLCIVMGYSGDVLRAEFRAKEINPSVELHYVLPESGSSIWFDMLMIPKGAKNLAAVYQFLNFNLDPYVAAMNSNYLFQPNASIDSQRYMNAIFNDPNVTPTAKMIKKMYVLKRYDPNFQAFVSRMWMYVKYGILFKPRYA